MWQNSICHPTTCNYEMTSSIFSTLTCNFMNEQMHFNIYGMDRLFFKNINILDHEKLKQMISGIQNQLNCALWEKQAIVIYKNTSKHGQGFSSFSSIFTFTHVPVIHYILKKILKVLSSFQNWSDNDCFSYILQCTILFFLSRFWN